MEIHLNEMYFMTCNVSGNDEMKQQKSKSVTVRLSSRIGLVLITLLMALATRSAEAQQLCIFCNEEKPYGGCSFPNIDHAGEFPGSVVRIPGLAEDGGDLVYIADYFSGLTHIFETVGGTDILSPLTVALSPGGSRPTSGMAYRHNDDPNLRFLYWAIASQGSSSSEIPPNPRLLRTSPDLNSGELFEDAIEINMVSLANLLNLEQVGTIGGITFHAQRNTFWGVDIVNDIYFEFDFSGEPIVEEGEVNFFINPSLGDSNAAYGNSITYVEVDGKAYFDIPHGPSSAGGATVVDRVFASAGDENGLAVTFGDATGHSYNIQETIGDHKFITGIGMVEEACTGQHIEVLLDIGEAGQPKIHMVNADTPKPDSRGVASFDCAPNGNNTLLTWKNYDSLQGLEISRRDTLTGETQVVLELPQDEVEGGPTLSPGEHVFTDPRISDGSYEYTLSVDTVSGDAVDDVTCLVTIGRGQLVEAIDIEATIQSAASVEASSISGVTHISDLDRLVVVDAISGRGFVFDLDLNFKMMLNSPFDGQFDFFGGQTISCAYNPSNQELTWLYRLEGNHYLQHTTLAVTDGEIEGFTINPEDTPMRVRNPSNLSRTPVLGDISYDSEGQQFWGVDRLNKVAYSFDRSGSLTGQSFSSQISNPRGNSGLVGGGLAVTQVSSSSLTLDWITGSDGNASQIARVSYIRTSNDEGVETIGAGTEIFAADLRGSTGSTTLGSLAVTESEEESFAFVLSADSGRLMKINMSEGIGGKKFLRGDANADGSMNISDPSFILQHLFRGGNEPDCMDAADVNDDELVDVSDAIYIFAYLFLGQAAPPEPFQECGFDLEPELPCARTICTDD